MKLWRLGARLWWFRPWVAALGTAGWVAYYLFPFFSGLALRAAFDALAGPAPARSPYGALAVLAAVEAAHVVTFFVAWVSWLRTWFVMSTLMRVNMLDGALRGPGPASTRVPGSPGEAVSRFRDDVEDVNWFVDIHLDTAGSALFAVFAISLMASIDAVLTVVVLLPMVAVVVGNHFLTIRIRRLHRRFRETTAALTSFLGEVFSGALTIKSAAAEANVAAALDRANRERRRAAVRDVVATLGLRAFNGTVVGLSIGLVLLVAAPSMRRGDFTVGELALFATYAQALAGLPEEVAVLFAHRRRALVATERMARLVDGDLLALAADQPIYLKEPPPPPAIAPRGEDGLQRLDIDGLTARHDPSGRGVVDVDLVLERASTTVVTGEVGAGKTTLVRAVLGLLPIESGTVRWNGQVLDDPGAFLVPPRAAYVPQVPRLFSESMGDNILLGLPPELADVAGALELSVLDEDVAAMEDGLATLLGARGVRLSGGQLQRAAVARALVRTPDLLVVDDPSSALDVETEEQLWARLGQSTTSATRLIVSHRPAVLERADQVVVLVDGRVEAMGTYDEVRSSVAVRRVLAVGSGP